MGRRQVAAVNLLVALRAICVKSRLETGTHANVSHQRRMIGAGWPFAMPSMTSQAEEGRRLVEQVVGYRSMRIVTDRTILGHRRMLVSERALLFSMAAITHHVDCRFLQIVFSLPMCIMAVRAPHLSFLDRMMRRHGILGIDVGVALIAHVGIVDRHWRPLLALDIRMLDVNDLRHVQVGMRIVAVGASDPITGMGR